MAVRVKPITETSWERALDGFLLFKSAQGMSQRTLDDYRYHVTLFFQRTRTLLSDFAALRKAILEYFASSASMSPATFNTRRKSLSSFFGWTVSEGMTPGNPCDGIGKMKEDEIPRSVDEDTLRRLLSLPNQTTFAGVRDYALMLLTMDTGIRPKEALALRIEDFSLRTLDVVIPASVAKTRVSRTLPLSPVTAQAVRHLSESRHPAWETTVPVFCTEDGETMSHNAWDRRMSIYSERLGVKVQPYALRHSFALLYLRQGGNAFSLQKTLGHTTLAMTKRYVALNQQDLKDQHAVASPLNSLLPRRTRVRTLSANRMAGEDTTSYGKGNGR